MTTKKIQIEPKVVPRLKLLKNFVFEMPYAHFLGIDATHKNNKLVTILPYSSSLIGNPMLPALHGGVTASFLEISAVLELYWGVISTNWRFNSDQLNRTSSTGSIFQGQIPKTIDFTIDYLRPGQPTDAYAEAEIKRAGRRYASVYVEAWQEDRKKLYAQASGHFLMPNNNE